MLTSTSFCKKGSLSDKLISLLFVGLARCMPVPQKLSSCVCDLLSVQHTCLHDQEKRRLQMLRMYIYIHWLFADNLKHIKYHTLQTLASRILQKHLFLVSSEMPQSKWTVDISHPTSHGKENSWVFLHGEPGEFDQLTHCIQNGLKSTKTTHYQIWTGLRLTGCFKGCLCAVSS